MYFFDKSNLSEYLQTLQKKKGTFDSPCLSVCNYCPETTVCQTCSMKKAEKILWKQADEDVKQILASRIYERQLISKANIKAVEDD